MAYDDVEVDYGEQTPQDFERFGLRHHARIRNRYRVRTFVDANLDAAVKRLGLTLRGWRRTRHDAHHYFLDVHRRPLEIRRYSDGRIKLFLDGALVYAENVRVVTRHGERYREIAVWKDPSVDDEENRQRAAQERQERLDAVRGRLNRC